MFQRVVVGVDFGGGSLEAASWVARHLQPEEVILVNVVRPVVPPAYIHGALVDPEALLEANVEDAARRLHDLRERLGVDCTLDVRSGDPATQLEVAAVEHEADVVFIGERGARRSAWGTRGRTAYALMARAGVPVWFCRMLREGRPRSVIAAVGAVASGIDVIAAARAAQQAWGARAELIHVVDRTFVPRPQAEEVSQRNLDEAVQREAETWLGEQRRKARVRGTDVSLEVVIGDPAAELLAALYRGEHDLLILRGPAPSSGLMPDRVSRALMSTSPASLLRLPTQEPTPEAA
ncbi:MAG TPA: universal stress protein [Longimicrobiales bacterium]|nr:universal stress protein [Longimicrobiales bacterium]